MQFQMQPIGIGSIAALVALILVLILCVTGKMEFIWLGAILLLLCVSRWF
jgi:hypothetical protein